MRESVCSAYSRRCLGELPGLWELEWAVGVQILLAAEVVFSESWGGEKSGKEPRPGAERSQRSEPWASDGSSSAPRSSDQQGGWILCISGLWGHIGKDKASAVPSE